MAQAVATKTLTALNDKLGPLEVPGGVITAGMQYGAGGQGTIVLEGTINDTDYIAINVTPAGGGASVANLAAAGIGTADVSAYSKVRINKSVAGAGGVSASLSLA